MEVDVAVVGGGPAGTGTAIVAARRGWKVHLFDSGSYGRRVYGETLPPEVNPLIDQLGLRRRFEALSSLESPGTISAWGDGARHEVNFIGNAYGPGWHVDRVRFDEMLCREAARSGAEVSLGMRVTSVRRGRDGVWELAARNGLDRERCR